MKKIVPFKKDLLFKTTVYEVTSISLEHNLKLKDEYSVSGAFILSGEYKISDKVEASEVFNFELPFDISIDEKYDTSKVVLDIDDFYYEIVDKNKICVNIDVLIDNLEEKTKLEENKERCIEDEYSFEDIVSDIPMNVEEKEIKQEEKTKKEEIKQEDSFTKSLFDNFDDGDNYTSYYVYIMRENDNVDSVIQKYNISKEIFGMYNNINDIKLGDKVIIPQINNETIQ